MVDRLPQPVSAPSTKADEGHEYISIEEVAKDLGEETTDRLRDLALTICDRGAEIARERGFIVADTKFELGIDTDGVLRWPTGPAPIPARRSPTTWSRRDAPGTSRSTRRSPASPGPEDRRAGAAEPARSRLGHPPSLPYGLELDHLVVAGP
ncbi:phosphoribosylaminoimidazolesuccinocarboxamide synthase [Promicromonospora umidemergens]|uniref:phosphoribosylaminoimidazolesuccinocarboxamide synthase n=1 Tax=Promicromonospora umidemergens TaxID=629679 RepID=A0ABP8XW41_9MICO|nr:phosphoribosylaminoimidazolesuccinocarboxamide synthase [Promicromonospora umidemergens]